MASTPDNAPTANRKLLEWVEGWAAILQPERVHWCDGSEAEYETLSRGLVESGTFIPARPGQAAEQLLRP